jgi:DNA-binding response OmpR family regulator
MLYCFTHNQTDDFELFFQELELLADTLALEITVVDYNFKPEKNSICLLWEPTTLNLFESVFVFVIDPKSSVLKLKQAFEAGAADYLKYPFHPVEFQARLTKLINWANNTKQKVLTITQNGHWQLNWQTGLLTINNRHYQLDEINTATLNVLLRNNHRPLSSNELMTHLNLKSRQAVAVRFNGLKNKLKKLNLPDHDYQTLSAGRFGYWHKLDND